MTRARRINARQDKIYAAVAMIEQTKIGLQHVLLGAEQDHAGLARKLASERLRAGKPQLPCDVGLFGDEHLQLDLVEMLQQPAND